MWDGLRRARRAGNQRASLNARLVVLCETIDQLRCAALVRRKKARDV